MFGRGRRWLGKVYSPPTTCSTTGAATGVGKNRFAGPPDPHPPGEAPKHSGEALQRAFDYSLEASALSSGSGSGSGSSTTSSLFQRYAAHCPPSFSPTTWLWRGMVDELRVVPLVKGGDRDGTTSEEGPPVLLGMGYFTWSGGAWNPAPFCLVPSEVKHSL